MSQAPYDDPDAEGAARAAQMLAMSVTVVEALARLRAQRAADRADADERSAAAVRAERLAEHATARVTWTPALDDGWLCGASTLELGAAWAAATPWAQSAPEAADVVHRVESRLHELHPDAMAAYHQARSQGAAPGDAMREAAQHFAGRPALAPSRPPGDPPQKAPPTPSRPPDVVAADAYPYPTTDAVARAARGDVHVITTAQARRPTATRAPQR